MHAVVDEVVARMHFRYTLVRVRVRVKMRVGMRLKFSSDADGLKG